jgi:predicted glycosyltransferase
MIYVQHLLGVGHLQRALQLAAALAKLEHQVGLVSGGLPRSLDLPAGVSLHQLAPLYSADASFSRLLDGDGNAIDDAWRRERGRQLLRFFDELSPGALITETFPFGRRMLRFELLPLLERARGAGSRVLCIASIRDILQPKSKPGRNREICDLVNRYYDHVLVHADPSIARLEDSFALAGSIHGRLAYSGYIRQADPPKPAGDDGRDEVLVSAGGSPTGFEILKCAIRARPLTSLGDHRWRILASPAIDESRFDELRRLAEGGAIVERNRKDFGVLMQRARLSISQAGYNTVTDILGGNTAAVLVPFAEAGELEQTLRAKRLRDLGRLAVLEQDDLSPGRGGRAGVASRYQARCQSRRRAH